MWNPIDATVDKNDSTRYRLDDLARRQTAFADHVETEGEQ